MPSLHRRRRRPVSFRPKAWHSNRIKASQRTKREKVISFSSLPHKIFFHLFLMMSFSLARTLLLSAVAITYVSASPALVTVLAPIPGGDQAGATILGVDKAGHTTYAIDEPVLEGLSGGVSSTVTVFTATLVAGSDYASETLSMSFSDTGFQFDFVAGAECTLSADKAICNDGSETITTDAAFVTANMTQVLDVVGPTPTSKTGAGVARTVLSVGALTVGAAVAFLGTVV
ncbi:hypothetical protein C8F01DRAFT_1158781 [Mycena amicta]|nr:hypothetical protein C8F01DRAFT_1158781 [Mycena amicta]